MLGRWPLSKFTAWATKEYSERRRFLTLLCLAVIFVLAIPLFLVFVCTSIDRYFGFPSFYYGIPNIIAGIVLIIAGFTFAMWSIYAQFTIGRGTPIPMMPTQKLVISRPFNFCRNPMTFGTILLYLGVAVWIGSPAAVAAMVLLDTILIVYIKRVEERELQERYGEEYTKYKKMTPFLIPRLRKHDRK
jgi:protein-S-isoprenylcysteine O-methyltransferase Ste14